MADRYCKQGAGRSPWSPYPLVTQANTYTYIYISRAGVGGNVKVAFRRLYKNIVKLYAHVCRKLVGNKRFKRNRGFQGNY